MRIPQSAALPLVEPYNTESLCLRPFLRGACPYRTSISGEHPLSALVPLPRRVKTQKQAKFRKHQLPSEPPDVSTKINQLHFLINKRKIERRRNLRILSKWKLRMKSTHPSQSRPPYTFTYVKKEYKNILTGFYSHHHSY